MCTQQIGKLGIPFQHPHYKAKLTEVKIINKLVENKPRDQLIEANNILKDENKILSGNNGNFYHNYDRNQ